jgi:predicted AlkP superfamily phosphohydrolase/phosphomutase
MQTILIGLDAFDPGVFERLVEQGNLPNLSGFLERKGYSRFSVSNPAQSEVSWTSIATGLNPGAHGIFDFVHRDPATYTPYVSLLPTKSGISGTQFVPPSTARTIFDQAVRQGYPATVLWWPATFPARPESPVRTFPGLGAPDIHGRLGVGTLFTTDSGLAGEKRKTALERLQLRGRGIYTSSLKGTARKKGSEVAESAIELELTLDGEKGARLRLGDRVVDLNVGEWSPIIEISFKVGLLYRLQAITRVILTQTSPEVRLYFLPLQLHPLHAPWRYATPGGFVKQTWQACGPFLTLGWPQDTTGLEEGCVNDQQFLDLCDSIVAGRERVLHYHLQNFREGILASVFDSLDRIQHMFWRDKPDIIAAWYLKLDAVIGRVRQALASRGLEKANLLVVSDHGFTEFTYKVHLNRWLIDQGYLIPKDRDRAGSGDFGDVDWSRSESYALGLNSIYTNLAGREGQGLVAANRLESLLSKLKGELLAWQGPDGRPVVQRAWQKHEALEGPLVPYGPDLLVGYSPGYRASAQTGLGAWEPRSIEINQDHWGADHCIDPSAVPGVLFSSRGLQDLPNPSYRDIPALAIGEKIEPSSSLPPSPPAPSGEDEEAIKERLKSLGYL